LVSRDFSERLLNKQNGGVGRGHEKTNCRQFVGKTMNVKKRNVDFRVSRIIVIGKGDIIITSGIINIDVIVKSSIFSIFFSITLKVYLTRLTPFRRTPCGAVK
jgi:hypothetical protein